MNNLVENRIICAANETFIKYGFYYSTIERIAGLAGLNKTAVHYYFRAKENLYTIVFKNYLNLLFYILSGGDESFKTTEPSKITTDANIAWFILNELKNNHQTVRNIINKDKEIGKL